MVVYSELFDYSMKVNPSLEFAKEIAQEVLPGFG